MSEFDNSKLYHWNTNRILIETNIKCGRCYKDKRTSYLLEDKEANYSHWRYYCERCEEHKIVLASHRKKYPYLYDTQKEVLE